MSRPLRIEYPGAWYHVMNRGRRSENLNTIGEMFNIKAYSTVSGIILRISRIIKYNRKIKKQIGKIKDSISMGL